MTSSLAEAVTVRGRFARSANLERDAGRREPLEGYVVTPRALEVIGRLTAAGLSGRAGGAWSLTGPYGSGKSSLALLLHAAFGPAGVPRNHALRLIGAACPASADAVRAVHRRRGTTRRGFRRGLVTAGREPIARTLLRGLRAVEREREREREQSRDHSLAPEADESPGSANPEAVSRAVVETARRLAASGPLLLVVDEFGKALEAVRDGGDADPYVLQQLAESGQGSGLPIFLLTLQHLAFEDTLSGADAARRREWAKVQGRFEDLTYVESPRQTREMIGSVFAVRDEALRQRIRSWARRRRAELRALGVTDGSRAETVGACYPLHPLASQVLPELVSRYGQHERTLFSFLAGRDPAGAAKFLEASGLPAARGPLPSLGLDALYDYFVGGGAATTVSLNQSSRWTEIATRLRDIHGLTKRQYRLAKSVAVLNLVSTGGAIRASREVLRLAEPGGARDLTELEARGVITWRDFAGEYRIWQGADTDIRRLLEACRERLAQQPLAELLSQATAPPPAVAARHSAQNHLLRVFARRFQGAGALPAPLDAFAPYDGVVLLYVGPADAVADLRTPAGGKPIIAAIPGNLETLDRAARERAAVRLALADPAVAGDPVARRELHERLAHAEARFDRALGAAFEGDSCRWVMLGEQGSRPLRSGRGSAALSEASDLAYSRTPVIRNEMLHRAELTSQGAKARRLLLEAMIGRSREPNCGIEGYGPEMAMVQALLKETGLHRPGPRDSGWVFGPPKDPSLRPAWEAVEREIERARFRRVSLRDIQAVLLSPPFGMKAGAVPVLLTAALLAHGAEVALYEHGTFRPGLTSELVERLVKNPGHFEIRHFASAGGVRGGVVRELAKALALPVGVRQRRTPSVVAIVKRLVTAARRWDRFTRRTTRLSPRALAVRDALLAAVEPDGLLFEALPAALGFPPVSPDARRYPQAAAYAEAVAAGLDEVGGRRVALLRELREMLLEESGETSRRGLAGQAAALGGKVLHPEVRAFVLTLANDAAESDDDWVAAAATVVAKKAPSEWADEDLDRFRRELGHRVAAFRRLVALHAEHRADGGGAFQALRVTFTRPDGAEHIGLAGVDDDHREEAEQALDTALTDLAGITGSTRRGAGALLALLGERLVGAEAGRAAASADEVGERRAARG